MTMTRNRANRKTVGRPKGVSAAPANTVGQSRQQLKTGEQLLKEREANLQAPSQPQPLCSKNNVPRNRPLHLRMSTSRRYYKVKVILGQLKIVKLHVLTALPLMVYNVNHSD